MKPLHEEDLKQLVAQWLREALALSEEARIEFGPYLSAVQGEEAKDLEQFEQTYRNALGRRDYSAME